MNCRRWIGPRRLTVLVGLSVALLLSTPPAMAHPWGTPPTAVVSVDGPEVRIEWRAETDDAVALATALGLLDPTRIDWEWSGPSGIARAAVHEQPLEEASALHAYLLDNIRVRQDRVSCRGKAQPIGDFISEGIRVTYRCPQEVDALQVRITMLHDLHAAYRTFAHASGDARPSRHVFTVVNPEHRWDFAPDTTSGGGGLLAGSWSQPITLALLAAMAVAGAIRQRRRRTGGRA